MSSCEWWIFPEISLISASFATFEPRESHAMHKEVDVKWLAYLIAMGRPNSGLQEANSDLPSAKKSTISIQY